MNESDRTVTWRSVLIGLAGVAFICGLTPYNDFVVNNTYLVGNYLPIGLVLFMLVLVMLVNAPLWKWAPRRALSSGELAVVLGMMLVASTLPSSGLMRYVPSHLVAFFQHAGAGGDPLRVMQEADLPDWLFPEMKAEGIQERANDPVVQDFWNRVWVDDPSFIAFWRAVPWSAWLRPMLTWGVLIAALYGAVLCMVVIVRRQWVENERLAFPLATIYLSLIETPAAGRGLNRLFSSRTFWIAFGLVFVIHGFSAMHLYQPRLWPEIPTSFDLAGIYDEGMLRYTDGGFKRSTLYFSIIGIAFVLQSQISFSLWAMYVLSNVAFVMYGVYQLDFSWGPRNDQSFGASVVFALAVLWIGRQHWLMVMRQMVRGRGPEEPEGRYLPYWFAGWGLVVCVLAAIGWLWMAGATLGGSVVLTLLVLMMFMVIARVVAETGLIFVQIQSPLIRPWAYMLTDVPEALAVRTTYRTYFFASWYYLLFTNDMRESLAPYATHAMRVADDAAYGKERASEAGGGRNGRGLAFMGALLLALLVGFFIAGAATLYVNYAYGSTLDVTQSAPVNTYGMVGSVQHVMNDAHSFLPPGEGPREPHNRLGHVGFGAGFMLMLSALRLRFVSWPFHPVGFLLVYSYPMRMIWFSILLGWLAKVLIVRFGGVMLFRQALPFFIGMIIGEAGAAAFWLVVSLVLNGLGMEYHAVRLLPG
jgi:hypothetical protein